jgi:hypothetical protein
VFSQVDNLACIEFLNRESQVRFLPGALPKVPGQGHFSELLNPYSEWLFRAVAPHWPRGRHGFDEIARPQLGSPTRRTGHSQDEGLRRDQVPSDPPNYKRSRRFASAARSSRRPTNIPILGDAEMLVALDAVADRSNVLAVGPGSPSRLGTDRSPDASMRTSSSSGIETPSSPTVRRGLPDRGPQRRQDTRAGTQGKHVRGALGRHRSTRVPRPRPDPRPTSPAAGPRRLRRVLQQGQAAPKHRPSTSRSRFLVMEWLPDGSDRETSLAGSFMSTSAARHDSYQDLGARQAHDQRRRSPAIPLE